MKKSYAILGLGSFGQAMGRELSAAGAEVLAVDSEEERVNSIADAVTCAVKADITDVDTMKSLGLSNMDAVIIGSTGNFDASVMACIIAKEAGVPWVVAKAQNEIHAKILEKVGADEVVIPEKDYGTRMARKIISGNVLEFIELSTNVRMIEMKIKPEWVGKSLIELNLRKKYKMNVVALRIGDQVISDFDPNDVLPAEISLLVIIDQKNLNKIM